MNQRDPESAELQERAETEAKNLIWVFPEKLKKCTFKNAWNGFSRLEVILYIRPHVENLLVSMELEIICPPLYPRDSPRFSYAALNGITNEDLYDLTSRLRQIITDGAGEVVIVQMMIEADNYLREINDRMTGDGRARSMRLPGSPAKLPTEPTTPKAAEEKKVITTSPSLPTEVLVEVRKEDEIQCQKNKMLNLIGPLGASQSYEILNKSGQYVNIKKVTKHKPKRSPCHTYCTEYFAWDDSKLVLVSEFELNFKMENIIKKKAITTFHKNFMNFLLKARHFPLPIDEELLTPYLFFKDVPELDDALRYKNKVVMGQYLNMENNSLTEDRVLKKIKKNAASLLPKLATQILCALKTLHDNKLAHGMLIRNNVWMDEKQNFILSDYWFTVELQRFCEDFKRIITNSNLNSCQHLNVKDMKQLDFVKLAELLESLAADCKNIGDDKIFEEMKNFTSCCREKDVDMQKLMNHAFLYGDFLSSDSSSSSSQSGHEMSPTLTGRLVKEYNVLGFLGKGAFGQVFLARNKLDSNDYAIKRINLTGFPKKHVEKIVNEVAVFSKLINEHIVRYFSSWTESLVYEPVNTSTITNEKPKKEMKNQVDVDESSSGGGFFRKNRKPSIRSSNILDHSQLNSEFSVIFEDDEDDAVMTDDDEIDVEMPQEPEVPKETSNAYLCLQMEYCRNGTLRTLIDTEKLYENVAMIWRLFKELLLGIHCLHEYNIIHRDIKPGNIFLDGNWSVKIGDFGLATRALSSNRLSKDSPDKMAIRPMSPSGGDSMTKDCGTSFYIPPEGTKSSSNKVYDTKFDIYSAGVVLFEMIQKPIDTGFERVKVLENLTKSFILTDNFFDHLPQTHHNSAERLLKWCLLHDPKDRPSATEVLTSGLIPHITSAEDSFQKIFSRVIRNPKHRLHKSVMMELFKSIGPSYAVNGYDKNFGNNTSIEFMSTRNEVITKVRDTFKLYGFAPLTVQSYVPATSTQDKNGALFMLNSPYITVDSTGSLLSAPYSLRQCVVRQFLHSSTKKGKYLVVDKLNVRPREISGHVHPETKYEVSVDTLGAADSKYLIISDFLMASSKLISSLGLKSLEWKTLVSHAGLIRAIASHFGINDDQTFSVLQNALYSFSTGATKKDPLKFELIHRCKIPEEKIKDLVTFLNGPYDTVQSLKEAFNSLIKTKKVNVRSLIDTVFSELDGLAKFLNSNNETLPITFNPGFVYQPAMFSDGIMFAIQCHGKSWTTVMAGGDYTRYINYVFTTSSNKWDKETVAYGFNLSVDVLSKFLQRIGKVAPVCDVLVASTSPDLLTSASRLCSELRNLEISVEQWPEFSSSVDELMEYCTFKTVKYLIMFVTIDEVILQLNGAFDKTEQSTGSFRVLLNRATPSEVVQSLLQKRNQSRQSHRTNSESIEQSPSQSSIAVGKVPLVQFTELGELKMSHHLRKKYINHVQALLDPYAAKFDPKTNFTAIITDLPVGVLNQISLVNGRDEKEIMLATERLTRQNGKHKKEIEKALETIEHMYAVDSNRVIAMVTRQAEDFIRVLI
ncbi:unnamed protein product [Bursaphelenchus okinawaensis]|uniref:non-specific serine/threonine protein kinase n=1 Tax=Bursaphelenchus okinawaensis TaxID=465554 RepID=A0A811KJI4_9BILA|nr:unnamed protein product [Bursaphelenchus okinawaensis]CAG9105026.1 unnamed protein product [Bursaphelenchus okinawaensis]